MANTNLNDINWSTNSADQLQSLIIAAGVTSTGGGLDIFYQEIATDTTSLGLGDGSVAQIG